MTPVENTVIHPEPMDHVTKPFAIGIKALGLPAVIFAAGFTYFATPQAYAQSFSCDKADQSAEFAICNDENLLILDEQMGKVFAQNYVSASTTPQRQAVTREQTEWLRQRNACGNDFTCLNLRYQERIKALQGRLS